VATVVFPTPEWVPATTSRGPRRAAPSTLEVVAGLVVIVCRT
jgi:hypothetical protein